jgi:hypothetical protein
MQRFMLAAATLALAGAGARAHTPTDPPTSGQLLNSGVAIVRVTNLSSGQVLNCKDGDGGCGPTARGGLVVLDTMTNEGSSAGLNVAYVNPGSYTGENPSTSAFAIGLAERLFYRAPMDQANGFPLPTDILWNDYSCDASRWPASQEVRGLGAFGFVPYFQNAEMPLMARTHTLRVQFFSANRAIDYGGFEAEFRVNAGQTGYQGFTIDLSAFEPAIAVPRDGLIMIDWVEPNNSGVGCMFTGGDMQNPIYPRPETLWTVGRMDPVTWWFGDGVTGEDGPPDQVDADFDGNSSGVSYLDILNTGALANWQFTAGSPPETYLPHDLACRLTVAGAPSCACDVNNSGALNSQDFFDYVTGFFAGEGDFNGSGETNSQDFFDFLICFFAGCE